MTRFLPKSLAGQLLASLLVALVVSQAASFLLFTGDRADAIRAADRVGLLESMAGLMRVLSLAPPAMRGQLAEVAGSPRIRFWTTDDSAVPAGEGAMPRARLAAQFERMFQGSLREPPRLTFVDVEGNPVPQAMPVQRPGNGVRRPPPPMFDVMVSVPFADGGWLNAQTRIRADPVPWPWWTSVSTVILALALFAIIGFVTRRATRPLRALAANADALGRGSVLPALPEAGPDEIRRLTAAFNAMQERLTRFIADRTRMLAAIGHDLRTPITSLKLRVELLDDEEAQAKMLATLDEMQRISEATLEFARDDATSEATRSVDLAALISSLADDLTAIGGDVSFPETDRLPYPCRPTALRRALGNLVQNALRYGERARISLAEEGGGPLIRIDDDGPGIPADRLEDVFKPFVRLEESRNRGTGGAGLGLSIARSIVLGHGGTLTLANRPDGGLRAEVRLPALSRGAAKAA